MTDDSKDVREIIIVRRGGGDGDGGHHGGAWKIAYADFVTAMMAFFLVMWLINSANEVTKSRVASYFNPIKMTDALPSGKGVKDITDKKSTEQKANGQKEQQPNKANSDKPSPESLANIEAERKLLENPYSALEEILTRVSDGEVGVGGDIANRTLGDPFDPKAWQSLKNGKPLENNKPTKLTEEDTPSENPNGKNSSSLGSAKVQSSSDDNATDKIQDAQKPPRTPDMPEEQEKGELAEKLEATLSALVAQHKSDLDLAVTVRKTDEGLLVILGDNSGKGMFSIGSAKPSPTLIEIVGVIGDMLSRQAGDVIVRGHTDSRQYRFGQFDNWQLSSARAQMASYMMIRGGLPEARLKRVEGHGSASLFDPENPLADANRRVEFLLREVAKPQ